MAESRQHIVLVKRIITHIREIYGDRRLFILSDLPEENQDNRPPKIVSYFPDVYATNPITDFTIIGEAKTVDDIETSHSVEQVREFVNFLKNQSGDSILLLSVPLEGVIPANRLLNIFKREKGPSTKFLILNGISALSVKI